MRRRQSGAGKHAVKTWRARALQLHIDGWTLRDIAAKVGKALSTVHDGIEAELNEITRPLAEQELARRTRLRDEEGMRLAAVIRGAMAKARKGDAEAAHVVISASRQRAKLFGLEAPSRTELAGAGGGPIQSVSFDLAALDDEHLDRLLARLDTDAAEAEAADAEPAHGASTPVEGGEA